MFHKCIKQGGLPGRVGRAGCRGGRGESAAGQKDHRSLTADWEHGYREFSGTRSCLAPGSLLPCFLLGRSSGGFPHTLEWGHPICRMYPRSFQAWSGRGLLKGSKSCEQDVLGGSRELGPLGRRAGAGSFEAGRGNYEAQPGSTQAPACSGGAEAICGLSGAGFSLTNDHCTPDGV